MVGFLETPQFPEDASAWAVGGRGFKTTIVETYGGNEYRTSAWAQQRGRWEIPVLDRVGNALPSSAYNVDGVVNFLRIALGRNGAFRFKDWQDFSATAAQGVFVTLTSTTFQMYRRYTLGSSTYDAKILKPRSGTVTVTGGTTPVVDYTTGIVTVASGTPTAWAGQYDFPVRLDDDTPDVGLDSSGALYGWHGLKLIEVRNP